MKMKAATLNFRAIFEAPRRNFDCLDALLSTMQLQLERMHVYIELKHFIFLQVKILPLVVDDCIFRVGVGVLAGSHEALVDVHPLVS